MNILNQAINLYKKACEYISKKTEKPRMKFQPLVEHIKSRIHERASLKAFCMILSFYTMIAYHVPFFSYATSFVDFDLNGVIIITSLIVCMLALNYFVYYLLIYLFRIVGKIIVAISLVGNAVCFYFIDTYNVFIDDKMMGNVFNTRESEASGFLSWYILIYAVILGVLPCIYLLKRKVNYGKVTGFLKNIGLALLSVILAVGINFKNFTWIDYNAPVLGSLLMPWSYTINSIRYYQQQIELNRPATILPDGKLTDNDKEVFVLIIGESARKENFSLYGYEKKTNPLLEKEENVTILDAESYATFTREAVKAILEYTPSSDLNEILPNYLYRTGIDVVWRTNNWGNPPIFVEKIYSKDSLKKKYPEENEKFDGILAAGVDDDIRESSNDKIFIVLHTYTSHGPAYFQMTPSEFKHFLPESQSVEMGKGDANELINAYDNTIVYTDYIIHSVIQQLKEFPEYKSCVTFISDHGESLGEGGFYMHGIPMRYAPKYQYEIPYIVWTSDESIKVKDDLGTVGQHTIYHSVLNFFGIDSPIYDESKNIFE